MFSWWGTGRWALMRTETELGHVFRLQAQKLGGHLVAYGIFFTVIALVVCP